jgi:hypothetical protein
MATRIIKKDDVVIEGTVMITKNGNLNARPPAENISARITEKNADFMVIEINCPCGRKSYVKCQYAKNESENISMEKQ